MPLLSAVQNSVFLSLPAVIYALSMARKRTPAADIVDRLGLVRGTLRPWLIALAACLPLGIAGAAASLRTKTFAGSALAGFVGASPTASVLASVAAYGVVATGFPEELLFRGLIAVDLSPSVVLEGELPPGVDLRSASSPDLDRRAPPLAARDLHPTGVRHVRWMAPPFVGEHVSRRPRACRDQHRLRPRRPAMARLT